MRENIIYNNIVDNEIQQIALRLFYKASGSR